MWQKQERKFCGAPPYDSSTDEGQTAGSEKAIEDEDAYATTRTGKVAWVGAAGVLPVLRGARQHAIPGKIPVGGTEVLAPRIKQTKSEGADIT